MRTHLRIARPVSVLDRSVSMYCHGLELDVLGRFEDHDGFDGVMIGRPQRDYHLEFTVCRAHPVTPNPTIEDLIVLYVPDRTQWQSACKRMLDAGFIEVAAFNPYWAREGRTFEDPDRYRVVLQQAAWIPG